MDKKSSATTFIVIAVALLHAVYRLDQSFLDRLFICTAVLPLSTAAASNWMPIEDAKPKAKTQRFYRAMQCLAPTMFSKDVRPSVCPSF